MTPNQINAILRDAYWLMDTAPEDERKFMTDVWFEACERLVSFCPQRNPQTAKYDNRRQ